MGWRFSFVAEPSGEPDWFDGQSFLAAKAILHSSGMVDLLVDQESVRVVADQVEELGHPIEANAIREFLEAGGPLRMLQEISSVSSPT